VNIALSVCYLHSTALHCITICCHERHLNLSAPPSALSYSSYLLSLYSYSSYLLSLYSYSSYLLSLYSYSFLSQAVRLLLNDVQGGFNIEYSGRNWTRSSLSCPLTLKSSTFPPNRTNPLHRSVHRRLCSHPVCLRPLSALSHHFPPMRSSLTRHYSATPPPLTPTHPHTPQTPLI
jgi:hypothetical protein